ncbi:MAG: hypothetical protein ACO3LF_03290 [Candidatus Kariarchaeum pelagius]
MKQFDRILVNGCSFVAGGHLGDFGDEYGNTHFLISLQEKLDCKYKSDFWGNKNHNIGEAAVSNDYICRVMIEWLLNNQNRIKNTLFIIGLTELSRIEYYDTISKQYRTFYPNEDTNDYWNERLFSGLLGREDGLDFTKKFYKYTFDDKVRAEELYLKLITLQDYIVSRGGELILFSSLCSEFNHKDKFNFFDFPNHNTWNEWFTEKHGGNERPDNISMDCYMAPCGHPGPKAYIELSEMFYNYIINKFK